METKRKPWRWGERATGTIIPLTFHLAAQHRSRVARDMGTSWTGGCASVRIWILWLCFLLRVPGCVLPCHPFPVSVLHMLPSCLVITVLDSSLRPPSSSIRTTRGEEGGGWVANRGTKSAYETRVARFRRRPGEEPCERSGESQSYPLFFMPRGMAGPTSLLRATRSVAEGPYRLSPVSRHPKGPRSAGETGTGAVWRARRAGRSLTTFIHARTLRVRKWMMGRDKDMRHDWK